MPLPPLPVCACPRPGIPVPVPGIPLVSGACATCYVTKSPMHGESGEFHGEQSRKDSRKMKRGIPRALVYISGYLLPGDIADFLCLEMSSVDIAYMTEFDPMGDDVKGSILT